VNVKKKKKTVANVNIHVTVLLPTFTLIAIVLRNQLKKLRERSLRRGEKVLGLDELLRSQ